ncbi:MAG: XcyI family restriction endonuclease, partial [FCB group bacterium]|nr:XcyI family restriction endonuclease [FCB group bacterium]
FQAGYTDFRTVTHVSNLDRKKAKRESPTTNRFYSIPDLVAGEGSEFEDFRNRIIGLTGIPDAK